MIANKYFDTHNKHEVLEHKASSLLHVDVFVVIKEPYVPCHHPAVIVHALQYRL
jgi:hypothetical protein